MSCVLYIQCKINGISKQQRSQPSEISYSKVEINARMNQNVNVPSIDCNTQLNNTKQHSSGHVQTDLEANFHKYTGEGFAGEDIYIPQKSRGHTPMQANEFEFICTDRPP